jgi:hypothetical protein
VRRAAAVAAVTAALLATGCGGGDDDAPAGWAGPPQPLPANGTVPIEEFTAFAESVDEAWERSPAAVAAVFADTGDLEGNVVVSVPSRPGGTGPASGTVVVDDLADDSIRTLRYELELEGAGDGAWRVAAATWSQRCQPGRGHQDFSPELCV